MTYMTTEAGKQIERALEQGYDDAAFNLYRDALQNDVELVMGEDSAEWHRDIQDRSGWTAIVADQDAMLAALSEEERWEAEIAMDEEAENAEPEPPLPRDARGRVTRVARYG